MKRIIHVNQNVIKANRKHGKTAPVLTVKTYKSNDYAHEAIIRDKDGNEIARVVYRPDKPLSCGAHVWIETHNDVELIVHGAQIPPPGQGEECCCYQGCEGKDAPWHQHADDPCPLHPEAPMFGEVNHGPAT